MSTPIKNGCLPGTRIYAPGTVVRVMPRASAQISARRNGHNIGQKYTALEDQRLEAVGYLAKISSSPSTPEGLYRLKMAGWATHAQIPASCIFGPSYNIGDVVEVGTSATPDVPPERRIFVGYAFDYKFNPVVHTYNAEDTAAILEDCNMAIVDLEESEIWDHVFPVEASLIPEAPTYEVAIKKNGSRISVTDMGRAEWCSVWDEANG